VRVALKIKKLFFFLVHIGPWFKLNVSHEYDFDKFYLVENNMSIEISISGLFMISVQVEIYPLNYNNSGKNIV